MTWEFCFDIFIAKFEQGTFKQNSIRIMMCFTHTKNLNPSATETGEYSPGELKEYHDCWRWHTIITRGIGYVE